MLRRRVMGKSGLYRQVEYIEGTGTQWIDALVNIQAINLGWDIDAIWYDDFNNTSGNNSILGWRSDGRYYHALYTYIGDGNNKKGYGLNLWNFNSWGSIAYSYNGLGIEQGVRFHISYFNSTGIFTRNDGTSFVCGNRITVTDSCSISLFTNKVTISFETKRSSARIFSFKVYDGDTNIRNFIPVVLTSDIPDDKCADPTLTHTAGTAGLWDLVEDKFYGNSGTGTFTYAEL